MKGRENMEQKRSPFARWLKAHHPRAYYTIRNRAHGMGGRSGGVVKSWKRGGWNVYLWRPLGWRYWRLKREAWWDFQGLSRLHMQVWAVEAYWTRTRAEYERQDRAA